MKSCSLLYAVCVFLLAGCVSQDPRLQKIAEADTVLILADIDGNKFAARHHRGPLWHLSPVAGLEKTVEKSEDRK